MEKVIVINNCLECPYSRYTNGVALCTNKELPNSKIIDDVKTIPEFCQLDDGEDYAEGAFNIDREK